MAQIQILDGDQHTLKRSKWVAIAATDPVLVDPPPRLGRNPATGEPIQIRHPPDTRAIQMDGQVIGSFEWSSYSYPGPEWDDDLDVVHVSYATEHKTRVYEIAERFAAQMGAELVLD